MSRVQVVVAFLVGCVVVCSAELAEAQSRYSINRPTFSPYLHLFRTGSPLIGQYQSYVRPKQALRRTLAGQTAAIQRQQRSIRGLQSEVTRFGETGPTRPTGTGSVFMNYSHYYPSASTGGGGRTYTRPPQSSRSGSYGGYGGY